jgi:hypothetical protein
MKKCVICKTPFSAFNSLAKACSVECAISVAQVAQVKKQRKSDKAKLEGMKSISQLKKEAQTAFNKYIRARDYGKPCISCGSYPQEKYGGNIDAGHYRSIGSAGHLRFNTLNCHAQCKQCNRFLSGNITEYRHGLKDKIGNDLLKWLENHNDSGKFDTEYLRRLKKIFNKRARLKDKKWKQN